MNLSKTTLLLILLAILIIITGIFAFQWWRAKGELVKQVEQNANLIKQIDELQKEIEELKTASLEDRTIEDKKAELTIATDKAEYRRGEKIKIITKNNSEKIFGWMGGWGEFSEFPFCWLDLQRFENDNWVSIQGVPFLCCPCGALCELPSPLFLGPRAVKETEWEQVILWCEDDAEKRKNILGKYRFKLRYKEANCKDPMNLLGCWIPERKEWRTTYSNEFVIK